METGTEKGSQESPVAEECGRESEAGSGVWVGKVYGWCCRWIQSCRQPEAAFGALPQSSQVPGSSSTSQLKECVAAGRGCWFPLRKHCARRSRCIPVPVGACRTRYGF